MTRYNRIGEVLESRGIKNDFLVQKLQVSSATVSRWCTNSGQPRLPMLYRVAKVLKVPVCELLVAEEE